MVGLLLAEARFDPPCMCGICFQPVFLGMTGWKLIPRPNASISRMKFLA